MTEEKARRAKQLVEELDSLNSIDQKVTAKYKLAKDGDQDAIEWLANVAIDLINSNVRHVKHYIKEL